LKQRKVSHVYIVSNISIAKENIKLIAMHILSRGTDSTRNYTWKNIRSFVKIEASQSAHLWVRQVYDFKKSQAFFAKCSKKQITHRYYTKKQKRVRYNPHQEPS